MKEFNASWATRIVLVFGVAVAGIFALRVEGCDASQRRSTCTTHVSYLIQGYRNAVAEDRFDPTLQGSAQILSWLLAFNTGDERMLFCPDDPDRLIPKGPEERRAYHPADAAALRLAVGLGSYAVRDFEKFPVAAGETTAWILCDRQGDDGRTWHHKDGLVVAFSSGAVEFVTSEDLGFASGDDIVVGPTSTHPDLRKMRRP